MTFTHVANEETWNALVQRLPGHGIYQSWSWGELRTGARTIVRRYALLQNGEPRAAAAVELRRLLRAPWRIAYAPRGPLWLGEDNLQEFMARLSQNLMRSGVLHLKVNPTGSLGADKVLREMGFVRVRRPELTFGGVLPELTARLPLGGTAEVVRSNMEPEARRRVRQAERRGISITLETTADALQAFYPRLAQSAARQKFWLPQEDALHAMVEAWLRNGEGVVLLAMHAGECIGGALCTFFGEEAMGHFLADDPEKRHLSAVYALYDAGMVEAIRKGCRFFDLGGIRNAQDDGLFRFKRQFGAARQAHLGEWNLPLRPLWYGALSVLSHGDLKRRI
ncbi:MAG: peptidoglycan bridge formation glycyltransferase FemA/FemB family protein [Thermaerobacter sp.]|nr:peptidoglycan bridge formation glycyltransferase FemA/FemB family protein [Thermaerobacter sp.]